MSMLVGVTGLTKPDEQWLKMKAVWDTCTEAGVVIPHTVKEYFDFDEPNEQEFAMSLHTLATKYENSNEVGYEIEVDNIPSNVKTIRFYVSF
jgi:hypothetical protein